MLAEQELFPLALRICPVVPSVRGLLQSPGIPLNPVFSAAQLQELVCHVMMGNLVMFRKDSVLNILSE